MRLLFSAAAAMAVFALTGCAGDSVPGSTRIQEGPDSKQIDEAAAYLQEASQAMSMLGSFRLIETVEPDGGEHSAAEFVAPDTYRIYSLAPAYETVIWGDASYNRSCEDTICDPWSKGSRVQWDTLLDPTGVFGHRWLLAALDLAEEPRVVKRQSAEIHIRAEINPIKVLLESQRRQYAMFSPGPSGKPCVPRIDPADGPCREYDHGAAIENSQPGYDIFEAEPAQLELWMSEDGLVSRYEITTNTNGYIQHIIHDYSDINAVTITPPGDTSGDIR